MTKIRADHRPGAVIDGKVDIQPQLIVVKGYVPEYIVPVLSGAVDQNGHDALHHEAGILIHQSNFPVILDGFSGNTVDFIFFHGGQFRRDIYSLLDISQYADGLL